MRTAIVALAALVFGGCSSHYMPRSHGRVAVTMIDGKPVYIRDGNLYEHGLLGGGLIQAVAGNRAAEAAATEYHEHMRDGLLEMLLGTAAMVGGMTYAAVEAAQSPDQRNPKIDAAPLIVGLAGMAVMLYGAGELASAEPFRWDAINLFNDAPDSASPPLGPPGYTASAAPKATLRMRGE